VLAHVGLNAIAAMPSGGRLRIVARRCAQLPPELADEQFLIPAGELALVRISDTGTGMDAETRRRAFDPFFTTKPRGVGTGLGLATAMVIVRDHGGHMGIASVPGQGTDVFVFLPLRQGRPQHERRTVDEAAPVTGCVLLADDEELVRSAARRVLEHAGLEVLVAEDGARAVEMFHAHRDRIGLVLLDLDMPNLDGEQALAAIRAVDPQVRVLISSGYFERAREEKLKASGIDGTLDKPYDSLTLLRAVAAALRDGPRRKAP
jgi:CheY-like chemotaxis protein